MVSSVTTDFEPLCITHSSLFDKIYQREQYLGWEKSFSSIYIESTIFPTFIKIYDNGFIIRRKVNDKLIYFSPYCFDETSFTFLFNEILKESNPFIYLISPSDIKYIDETKYQLIDNRNNSQYIYTPDQLLNLAGKNYHPKRTFIGKFMALNPFYKFIEYQEEFKPLIIKLLTSWNMNKEDTPEYDESSMILFSIENKDQLGLEVYCLFSGKKLLGFCVWKIQDEVAHLLYEKADINMVGSYQIINQLEASILIDKVKWINRQEDLGFENLRKSKLSYYPTLLLSEYEISIED